MTDRPLVIVNPKAKNGRVEREWPELKALIESEAGPFEVRFTRHSGHASQLATEALEEGYRTIGSLGGDGTHSQVVNGFFADGAPIAADASLAVLPLGTGGDFRRMLPVDPDDVRAFARLMRAPAAPIDVGHLELTGEDGSPGHHYFLNIASFGVSGLADRIVNRGSKVLGGRLTYMLAGARALFEHDPPWVHLTVDGEELGALKLLVAAASNGRYFGGGMKIAPNAQLDDGQLDLVVLPWRGKLWHLSHGFDVYSGKHLHQPGTRVIRLSELRAESDRDCWLDIDGEMLGKLPITLRVVPGALRLRGHTAST